MDNEILSENAANQEIVSEIDTTSPHDPKIKKITCYRCYKLLNVPVGLDTN